MIFELIFHNKMSSYGYLREKEIKWSVAESQQIVDYDPLTDDVNYHKNVNNNLPSTHYIKNEELSSDSEEDNSTEEE